MNFDQSSQKLIGIGAKKTDHYKGLLIRADYQLHAQYAEEIQSRLAPGSSILDFGCGQGSLSLRLKDIGYNVIACDQNKSDFKAEGEVPFHALNFNSSQDLEQFLKDHENQFDAVLGVEVIEHVENPWQYLRDLQRLVKPGGIIIISTPNITSWYSRMVFLLTGQFPGFIDPDFIGHINPISPWEIQVIAQKLNLEIQKIRSAGNLPLVWISGSIPKTMLSFCFFPLSFVARGLLRGWCTMAILRKKNVP